MDDDDGWRNVYYYYHYDCALREWSHSTSCGKYTVTHSTLLTNTFKSLFKKYNDIRNNVTKSLRKFNHGCLCSFEDWHFIKTPFELLQPYY